MVLDRYWVSPIRQQYFNDIEEDGLEPGQAEMFLGNQKIYILKYNELSLRLQVFFLNVQCTKMG